MSRSRIGWLCALLLAACGTASVDGAGDGGGADAGSANRRDAGAGRADASAAPGADAGGSPGSVLHVQGREVLDRCGAPFAARGVEQVFGLGLDVDGSWAALADEIALSGSNAVRILPNLGQLSTSDVEAIIARFESHDMVVFISPGDRAWFGQSDVKAMLLRHEAWVILDVYQEPDYDDRTRWLTDATAAVQAVRAMGYAAPFTVLANLYGRDLPVVLDHGAEIEAADPAHNTILGWQAYWGQSGWYQGQYGMSLTQGIAAAAAKPFPVQIGILTDADPGDPIDYVGAMAAAQQSGTGWLWWNWWNPFGTQVFNLTGNGTYAGLNGVGAVVVNTDANGIRSTARKACRP